MSAATNTASAPQKKVETGGDPSMEEILASIRRIIADDQALPLTRQEPEPQPAVEPESVSAPAPPPAPSPASPAAATEPAKNPLPKLPRGPARPLAQAPQPEQGARARQADSVDSDFEAWLSETAAGVQQEPPASQQTPVGAKPALSPAAAAQAPAAKAPVAKAPAVQPPRERVPHVPADVAPEAAPMEAPQPAPPRFAVVDGGAPHRKEVDFAVAQESEDEEVYGDSEADGYLDTPVTAGDEPASELETLLLSHSTSSSVSASFQALSQTMLLQHSSLIEESIREMLRPMLKQWLDDNLPTMVERLVRAEIERVARGGP